MRSKENVERTKDFAEKFYVRALGTVYIKNYFIRLWRNFSKRRAIEWLEQGHKVNLKGYDIVFSPDGYFTCKDFKYRLNFKTINEITKSYLRERR